MTRRQHIAALLSAATTASRKLRADSAGDAHDVIAVIAGSLAEGDFTAFQQCLRRDIPALEQFAGGVRGLLAEFHFTTSIKPLANTGDDSERRLELDWYLELKARSLDLKLVRRQAVVTCIVTRTVDEKNKKKSRWLVSAIDHAGLFAAVEAAR